MKKRVTMFWLIPAAAERELFRDIIRILAEQFNAARFEPHVTLSKSQDESSPSRPLRQLRCAPVRLQVRDITHSAKFTQTLIVRFRMNRSLSGLIEALGGDSAKLKHPHLSLLYRHLPSSSRRQLAAAIQLPFREVVFDAVKVVSCVSPTETKRDVESWRVIGTKRLVK